MSYAIDVAYEYFRRSEYAFHAKKIEILFLHVAFIKPMENYFN